MSGRSIDAGSESKCCSRAEVTRQHGHSNRQGLSADWEFDAFSGLKVKHREHLAESDDIVVGKFADDESSERFSDDESHCGKALQALTDCSPGDLEFFRQGDFREPLAGILQPSRISFRRLGATASTRVGLAGRESVSARSTSIIVDTPSPFAISGAAAHDRAADSRCSPVARPYGQVIPHEGDAASRCRRVLHSSRHLRPCTSWPISNSTPTPSFSGRR